MNETELYEPVKALLEAQAFTVKGEVGEIDVFAMRNNESIAIELKTKISLKLLYQAVERQKLADSVYIAIPLSAKKSHSDSYHHFVHLLRRLEIGLIIVSGSNAYVEIEAVPYDRVRSVIRSKKKKTKIISEFQSRISTMNVGGTKGKKMTHYKEKVLLIGAFLLHQSNASPKEIKLATHVDDTPLIIQKNYYGWFIRISRGRYGLSASGEVAMSEYAKTSVNQVANIDPEMS